MQDKNVEVKIVACLYVHCDIGKCELFCSNGTFVFYFMCCCTSSGSCSSNNWV